MFLNTLKETGGDILFIKGIYQNTGAVFKYLAWSAIIRSYNGETTGGCLDRGKTKGFVKRGKSKDRSLSGKTFICCGKFLLCFDIEISYFIFQVRVRNNI
jgi:hypothetical protein